MKYFSNPIRFKNDPLLKTYILLISITYIIFITALKVWLLIIITLSFDNCYIKLIILIVGTKEAMPIIVYLTSVYLVIFYLLYQHIIMFLIDSLISGNKWFYQDIAIYSILYYNTDFILFEYLYLNLAITLLRFFSIQVYNAYLSEPPVGFRRKHIYNNYITFKKYEKATQLFFFLGDYFLDKKIDPWWWANQIVILFIILDFLTLLFLPGWIIIFIFIRVTSCEIILSWEYLYQITIINFLNFISRYILIVLKIPEIYRVRYSITSVIRFIRDEGAPYMRDRGIMFSTEYGWV